MMTIFVIQSKLESLLLWSIMITTIVFSVYADNCLFIRFTMYDYSCFFSLMLLWNRGCHYLSKGRRLINVIATLISHAGAVKAPAISMSLILCYLIRDEPSYQSRRVNEVSGQHYYTEPVKPYFKIIQSPRS
jgi:hypothetical protein